MDLDYCIDCDHKCEAVEILLKFVELEAGFTDGIEEALERHPDPSDLDHLATAVASMVSTHLKAVEAIEKVTFCPRQAARAECT